MAEKHGSKDKNTQAPARRRCLTRPVAECASPMLRPILRKYGLAEQQLLDRWPDIVGPHFAPISHPERLRFPRGEHTGGTLHIRVASGWGLELQHHIPVLLEKIAVFFGYRAIERITITQDPALCNRKDPDDRRPAPHLSKHNKAALDDILETVSDPSLRDVLERLGKSIYQQQETLEHSTKDA